MSNILERWGHAARTTALLSLALAAPSGCGGKTMSDVPKISSAVLEPAPMSVVVLRSDFAENAALYVDRVMTATPDETHITAQTASDYPGLLAAFDPDLSKMWTAIMERKTETRELKAALMTEKVASSLNRLSQAERDAHQSTIDGLNAQIATLAKESHELTRAMVPWAKMAVSAAPSDARKRFGAVFAHLRHAVVEAEKANGFAAIRYPLARSSMLDSLKRMARVYTADVVEEKTGRRPLLASGSADVTLVEGLINVNLSSLPPVDIGKMPISALTYEVQKRTTMWFNRAMRLSETIATTSDVLAFQKELLDALQDGFSASEFQAPASPTNQSLLTTDAPH